MFHARDPFLFLFSHHANGRTEQHYPDCTSREAEQCSSSEHVMLLSHKMQRDGCWYRLLSIWAMSRYIYDNPKSGQCQDKKEVS